MGHNWINILLQFEGKSVFRNTKIQIIKLNDN